MISPSTMTTLWAAETMAQINALTPNIEGKAFDPGWFLLRQRLEQAGRAVESSGDLMAACEAVLLFYKAGHWSQDEDNRWKELLGVHRERSSHGLETWSFEVTTKRLCDFVREAIDKAKGEVTQ